MTHSRGPLHPHTWLLATTIAGAFLGGILASGPLGVADLLGSSGYLLAPLVALFLYFASRAGTAYLTYVREHERHMQQMSDLHLSTIEALAVAIDAKDDQTAQNHIRRVHAYAAGLAKAMGMSDSEIQGVKTAALLHDIGKLAIPEHILSKPGPLTQEEFQKVRAHAQIGAEIISNVPFPYPVAPLILSHHERWDGKGYPMGLEGEEIPLGARVLTVVDYFDAVRSDRPYHPAMSLDAAIGLLRLEAGKALDPSAVQTFLDIYPRLAEEIAVQTTDRRSTGYAPETSLGQAGLINEPSSSTANVFDDIARAHREIYALYEIAQTMGSSLAVSETMALIASKLTNIVPVSCCALFIFHRDTDMLRCQFAKGVDAEHIQDLTIRDGQGLVGWVARNRRPLVNARPSADFEAAGSVAQTSLQAALVCPLVCNERFIGSLAVYHTVAGTYTDDHRRLLDRISEQAAAVISNSLAFEQTVEESLTDPLTALPNTRFMFMHLTQELARAKRLKSDVTLLVMDLDDFKAINDTYGHQVGDRALRDVATVLKSAIRDYDECVRYAGDEFIVVLSTCGREEGERRRLDLQRAINNLTLEPRAGQIVKLAISAGAAVFPEDGESHEMLVATADSRMYRDKAMRKQGELAAAMGVPALAGPVGGSNPHDGR
jgi:diguanylate cyclase (GGDEF)-like protein/putative nucleotidyltransferase with HDIG domain